MDTPKDEPKDEVKDQVKDVAKDAVTIEPRHLIWKTGRDSSLYTLYEGDATIATMQTYGRDPYAEFVTSFGKFIIKSRDLSDRHIVVEDTTGKLAVDLRRSLVSNNGDLEFGDGEMQLRLKTNMWPRKGSNNQIVFEDTHGNPLVGFGRDRNYLTATRVEVYLSALSAPKQMLLIGMGEYIWLASSESARTGVTF